MNATAGWPPIETERLLLRRHSMDDLEHLVRLNTDPAVLRYLDAKIPTSNEIESQLRHAIDHYGDDPAPGRLTALLREGRTFVGRFSLDSHPTGRTLSLGYRLVPACWGQGLATEGARALIEYGFGVLGTDRIRAQTMFVNAGHAG
ncbi:MAG: GNAT family N-acetyltransferase [Thermomicrobiales bacterium]